VPPFVGVAVKITEVPAQILFPVLAEIETAGTKFGLTVTFELSLYGEEHPTAMIL
jgi:hypothetical protein